MSYARLPFVLVILITACTDRDKSESETATNSSGVFMASQERNIQYVDSVPALEDQVDMFLMQAVEKPYYDTIYNSSSLVIETGDSINIHSFPGLKVHGFLKDSLGEKFLVVPEFNDSYLFRLQGDSLLLGQAFGKIQRETYLSAIAETEGELNSVNLPGTSWNLRGSIIEHIDFVSDDSCIIRANWPEHRSYTGIGKGAWSAKSINGRVFINFYSQDPQLPNRIFQTHYISEMNPGTMNSKFYREVGEDRPVKEQTVLWSLDDNEGAAEELMTQMVGTWESRSDVFAGTSDSLRNKTVRLTLSADGNYQIRTIGTVKARGSDEEFTRSEKGSWFYNSKANYISFISEEGAAYEAAISDSGENSMVINMILKGFGTARQNDFKPVIFTKKTGV